MVHPKRPKLIYTVR